MTPAEGSRERSAWIERIAIWAGIAGLFLISAVAFFASIYRLDRLPGGLAGFEAEYALIARSSSNTIPEWLRDGAGDYSALLLAVLNVVGGVTGFDAQTPRVATALIGAGTVLLTGLWLRREMGAIWGLTAAAVMAGAFWNLLFSRLGMGSISAAFALAGLLWCLSEARSRSGNGALVFYSTAGAFAGLAFVSAPALRLVPLVVLASLIAAVYRWYSSVPRISPPLQWVAAIAAASPFLIWFALTSATNPRSFTPWAPTPGLPAEETATLVTVSSHIMVSVRALVLPGDAAGEFPLPTEPALGLLLLPWAVFGLLALVRATNEPKHRDVTLFTTGLLAAILVGVSAVDPGHPGHQVVIGPLLAGATTCGFRAVLRWANLRSIRLALGLLIVAGILGNAYWTSERYRDWATDEATRASLNAGTVDAYRLAGSLESEEHVLITTRAPQSVLAYLGGTHEVIPVDGSIALPIPVRTGVYVLVPDEYPIHPLIEDILETAGSATGSRDEIHVTVYRVDDRVREQFPLSVPTMHYSDGTVFHGYQMRVQADGRISVLSVWQLPAMHPNYELDLRLRTANETRQLSEASIMLAGNPFNEPVFEVSVISLDIPELQAETDLEIRLRDADGEIVPAAGIDQTGFLFLNRYVFERSN